MFTSYLRINGIRIFLAIGGLASVLFAPWWVPLLCMLILSLRYPAWEVLAIGLLMDFMWLPGGVGFSIPLFTILVICIVWMFGPLRNQLLTS